MRSSWKVTSPLTAVSTISRPLMARASGSTASLMAAARSERNFTGRGAKFDLGAGTGTGTSAETALALGGAAGIFFSGAGGLAATSAAFTAAGFGAGTGLDGTARAGLFFGGDGAGLTGFLAATSGFPLGTAALPAPGLAIAGAFATTGLGFVTAFFKTGLAFAMGALAFITLPVLDLSPLPVPVFPVLDWSAFFLAARSILWPLSVEPIGVSSCRNWTSTAVMGFTHLEADFSTSRNKCPAFSFANPVFSAKEGGSAS